MACWSSRSRRRAGRRNPGDRGGGQTAAGLQTQERGFAGGPAAGDAGNGQAEQKRVVVAGRVASSSAATVAAARRRVLDSLRIARVAAPGWVRVGRVPGRRRRLTSTPERRRAYARGCQVACRRGGLGRAFASGSEDALTGLCPGGQTRSPRGLQAAGRTAPTCRGGRRFRSRAAAEVRSRGWLCERRVVRRAAAEGSRAAPRRNCLRRLRRPRGLRQCWSQQQV